MQNADDQVAELAAILDKQRIRDLFTRIARGSDRVDGEMLLSGHTEASVDEHGPFKGTGREFAARPERYSASNVLTHHQLGQSSIDLQGDVAYCETYFIAHQVIGYGDGETLEMEAWDATSTGWSERTAAG